MCDVFISFSTRDKQIADAVLNALEGRKIKGWIAYRDADVGEEYAASIVRAIKACKIVVLIYSESSNASKHVLNEINSAVNAGKIILPFKISDFCPCESFEYYLGKTHWLDAVTPPLQKHIDMLCDKVVGVMAGKSAEMPSPPVSVVVNSTGRGTIRTAQYEELLSLGYTAATIAMQLVENDYITCNGIGEANEGTAAQWEEILRDYNDNFIYMLDDQNKIIGDISMVALPEELMQKAKEGKFLEAELSYDEVEFIGFPGDYYGYILAISILPDYRNTKNNMLLLNAWVKHLEELSDDGVFFREWCMNVFSRDIETLVKGMGFRYVCDNIEFGKIYSLPFMPLPQIKFFRQHEKLVKNYEEHYNEAL